MENRQQRTIGFRSGTNYALREYMFLYLLFTYSSVKNIYKRNRQNKAVPDSEKFLLITDHAHRTWFDEDPSKGSENIVMQSFFEKSNTL